MMKPMSISQLHKSLKHGKFKICSLAIAIGLSPSAIALPQGQSIQGGQVNFEQKDNTLTVNQQSDLASINYESFDIAAHETVIFQQPSTNSIALNRVLGDDPSSIFGQLSANGQIFLLNPNGVVFGENARVDVGGLLAGTMSLSDEDFFARNFNFLSDGSGSISNAGILQAAEHGYVALLADNIENSGEIRVPGGSVHLLASDEAVLTFFGDSVSFVSNQSTVDAFIENHGLIQSENGLVVFNADARDALHQTVVNNTGVVEAESLYEENGEIVITGGSGDVILGGTVDAKGLGSGGDISVAANRIAVTGRLDASADAKFAGSQSGGHIRLDAVETNILADGADLRADAGETGDGGEIIVFSPGTSIFHSEASLSATGGDLSGDGGFIEVSGLEKVEIFGRVDTSSAYGEAGTFYIDPYDITISAGPSANGAFDGGSPDSWLGSGTGTSSTIDSSVITTSLSVADVIINTALDDGSGPGTGTGNITITTDIDLDGGDGNTLSFIADGNLVMDANVKIQDATTATPDAVNVNLTVGGNLTLNNDADIITTGGNSTVLVGGNFITFGNSSIQTGTGLINISTADLDLIGLLRSDSTASNAITITSGTQIADGGAGTLDIRAPNGGVVLDADDGIQLDVDTRQISLTNTDSGTVVIDPSGDIEITDVNAIDAVTVTGTTSNVVVSGYTNSGALTINTDGTITVNDGVLVDVGSSQIDLDATGDITLTGLTTTNTGANAISVTAGGSINDSGDTNTDIDASDGRVQLNAQTGINDIETRVNLMDLSNATSGSIVINESNNLGLFSVASVDDLTLTAGTNLTINSDIDLNGVNGATYTFNATNDISIDQNICEGGATCSFVDDSVALIFNSNGAINMTDGVTVDAGNSSIAMTASNGASLDGLVSRSAANNAIDLTVSGATISGVSTAGSELIATAGGITINSALGTDSSLDIEASQGQFTSAAGGNFAFRTNGDFDLAGASTTGSLSQVAVGGTVNVTGNTSSEGFTLSSNGNININDGVLVDAGSGQISLVTTGGSIAATGLATTNATATAIQLQAGLGGISDAGNTNVDLNASNGGVALLAGTGIDLDLNVDSVDAANLTSGGINLEEQNALTISSLDWGSGNVDISTLAGDLVLDTGLDLDGSNGSTVTLNAANDLQVTSNQDIIDSATASLDAVNLNLIAGNDVFVQINNEIFSYGGDITITAANLFDTRNATEYYSSGGKVNVNAGDVSLVSTIQSDNADSDAISITSANQIVDGGGAFTDLVAANGGVVLQAVNGINLDTEVGILDLSNTGTGAIVIDEVDALTLSSYTGVGDFTLNAGGVVTLPDAGIDVGSNSLSLSASDLIDSDRAVTLAAGTLTLNTQTLGGDSVFNTTATTLDLTNTGTNQISINETDALSITNWSNVGDSLLNIGGALSIPDAGLNEGTNDLTITATDIVDSDRTITLAANILTLDTQVLGGDSVFNTDAAELVLTNGGSNLISVNESDDLTLSSLSLGAGSAQITAGNDLNITTNDIELDGNSGGSLGLSATNNLSLDVSIQDTLLGVDNDTDITLNAAAIAMGGASVINAGAGNISLTSTVGDIDLSRVESSSTDATAIQINSAAAITDAAAGTNVIAQNGGAVLTAVSGIDNTLAGLETDVAQLSLTNSGSGRVRIVENDDLSINVLSASGSTTSTEITSSAGSIILPTTNTVSGALFLNAAGDINDGDRSLDFTSMDSLSFIVGAPTDDLTLNTDLDSLQVQLGGSGNITVVEANGLTLSDLDGSGSAISLVLGDIDVQTAAGSLNVADDISTVSGDITLAAVGDMQINGDISAADLINDGVRQALIDISVDGGNLDIGGSGEVNIISSNGVDQDVSSSLGTVGSNEVSVRVRQLDSGATPLALTLGDGTGNDVLIRAVGGDVLLESKGSASVDPINRPLILNSDVSIEAFNNLTDTATGEVQQEDIIDNGANLVARAGRLIRLNGDAPDPVVADPTEGLLNEVADIESTEVNDTPAIVEAQAKQENQVSNVFSKAFGQCGSGEDKASRQNCQNQEAIVSFLNAFIIGGELPAVKN